MQNYRIVPRTASRVCKPAFAPARAMFNTPFFPGHFGPTNTEFTPLFRPLDSAAADLMPSSARDQPRRSFRPKFDVREIGATYELQGELPGIEQKDLEIEFVDERTLVIRGHTGTTSTKTNEPAPAEATKAVENGEAASDDSVSEKSVNYRKASVEDEYVDVGAESAIEGAKTPGSTPATPAAIEGAQQQRNTAVEPSFKYWINERSVGEFERRFSFPGRVDQEAVKASLRDGILSVVVPKVMAKEARRINIE